MRRRMPATGTPVRLSRIAAIALAMLLGAGAPSAAGADPAHSAQDRMQVARIAAGAAVYQTHCRRCHRISDTQRGYGPALSGVVGRPAGTQSGYRYSDGLADTGFVWTRDSLRVLLAAGPAMIDGLRCVGRPDLDPLRQEALIDYLETTSAGTPPRNI
ncbi:MAG: c-type cytochrome [Rhodobacteraceae bacterium]|nr:c-type cytochrome [Paracoccaceae bacterium]